MPYQETKYTVKEGSLNDKIPAYTHQCEQLKWTLPSAVRLNLPSADSHERYSLLVMGHNRRLYSVLLETPAEITYVAVLNGANLSVPPTEANLPEMDLATTPITDTYPFLHSINYPTICLKTYDYFLYDTAGGKRERRIRVVVKNNDDPQKEELRISQLESGLRGRRGVFSTPIGRIIRSEAGWTVVAGHHLVGRLVMGAILATWY